MHTRIDQVVDGDTIAVPTRGLHFACCDCGLTHTLKPVIRGNRVSLKVLVNKRVTRTVRRSMNAWTKR